MLQACWALPHLPPRGGLSYFQVKKQRLGFKRPTRVHPPLSVGAAEAGTRAPLQWSLHLCTGLCLIPSPGPGNGACARVAAGSPTQVTGAKHPARLSKCPPPVQGVHTRHSAASTEGTGICQVDRKLQRSFQALWTCVWTAVVTGGSKVGGTSLQRRRPAPGRQPQRTRQSANGRAANRGTLGKPPEHTAQVPLQVLTWAARDCSPAAIEEGRGKATWDRTWGPGQQGPRRLGRAWGFLLPGHLRRK